MTYESNELSVYNGEPIELYTFEHRFGEGTFRYTTADHDVFYAQNNYTAVPIRRDAIKLSQSTLRTDLKVYTALTAAFVQQYVGNPPSTPADVTVVSIHGDDTLNGVVVWSGRVLNLAFGETECTITCEPLLSAVKRNIARRLFQTKCSHLLYGNLCQADVNSFTHLLHATVVNGSVLGSLEFDDFGPDYFMRGQLIFSTGGKAHRRMIIEHFDTTIVMSGPIPELENNDLVQLIAGCPLTAEACTDRFNNYINYGGFPYTPPKNPMGGSSVY